MAKGIWRKRIDALVDGTEELSPNGIRNLKGSEGAQKVFRDKLILSFRASVFPLMKSAAKNHNEFSAQINEVIDIIVSNSERDGIDLDGEMLNLLTDISGKLYAVETTWDKIYDSLNENKGI